MLRKFFFASVCLLILIASCQKEIVEKLPVENEAVRQQVTTFLESQKKVMSDSTAAFLSTLIKNIDWTSMYVETNPIWGKRILFSLKRAFKIDKALADGENAIVLTENERGLIRDAHLISLTHSKNCISNTNKLITDLMNDLKPDFTGVLIKMFLNKQLCYEVSFDKGQTAYFKTLRRKKTNVQTGRTDTCIDWYWITTYTYPGGYSYTTEEYAFTTCAGDGDECPFKIVNGTVQRINCPGGGGSGPGGGDTIVNPCAHASALSVDSGFRVQMLLLKSVTNLNYENGYVKGKDANGNMVYQLVQGNPGQPYLPGFNFSSPVDGMLHSHFAGGFSIFSPADLLTLYSTYHDGHANPGFTFAVTTPNGNYVLEVTDVNAFLQYGAAHLSDQTSFNQFQAIIYAQYGIYEQGSQTTNETGFINMIQGEGMGLKLLSSDDTFQTWHVKDVQNNMPINVNCG